MSRRKLLILLLLVTVILAPDFVYNLFPDEVPYGWLSSRFLSGSFDLSKQALPPAYQEVRQWLDTQVQPGDIFRLFWLPVDPAVISTLEFMYPDTPLFFPRFDERNYTQTIFDYISNAPNLGWNTGLGKMLANANVKYVIVNLSANDGGGIWKQQGPPSLSPWGPSWSLEYYFTGDPKGYEQFLDREQHLKLVVRGQHFLAYENMDFMPYFTAYRSTYLVLPTSVLDQRIPAFSVYNYSNNLIQNGGFENGTQSWGLEGNWFSSKEAHSGKYAIEANRTEDGWVRARQDVVFPAKASYYLSGWMRVQNVRQSHVRLTFYASSGNPILQTYPQSGIDGTRDWWHVSESGVTPPGTSFASVELMAGWSLDKTNSGQTWFDDISFFWGYFPNPSPIHFWAYPIFMSSSIGNLLSDVPTFGDKSLLVSSETVSPATIDDQGLMRLGQISTGLVLMGDILSNSTLSPWIDQFPRLVFVYEAESVLQPEMGKWGHLSALSIGTPEGVELTEVAQGNQNFNVPRNSNYTIAIHATINKGVTVKVDNVALDLQPFSDDSGQLTSWSQTITTHLTAGEHRLTIATDGTSTILDKIVMLSSLGERFKLQDLGSGIAPSISFTKVTSTHYRLQLDTLGVAFVLFGETFDSSWNAYNGPTKLLHQPLPFHMYWSNLYSINAPGRTTIEVYFEHQSARNTIVAIWEGGWLLSLGYVGTRYADRVVNLARRLRRKITRSV